MDIIEKPSAILRVTYQIGNFLVDRGGNIECPDETTEEEIENLIKKLTWHGFERILDEPEDVDTPIVEEATLEEDSPTDEPVADIVDTTIENPKEVFEETVVSETEDTAIVDSDISKEAFEESESEPEVLTLPEGNFEFNEELEEIADEEPEPIVDISEQYTSEEVTKSDEESEEAVSASNGAENEQPEETPDTAKNRNFVIELPGSYLDEAELGRVRAIVASKASVLKKALETDDLSIERKEDKICFPWFTDHGIEGEAKAYMQLVSGIAKRAKMLTRVTATESVSDNDKFTMRLFLVSLNFKGEEYKFARKFLLRNLSGNSSWRTEDAKARHDARKVQQEIEAPEVTIGQLSEGGEDHAELPE
ncbi:hypothetical protein [Faecalicatena contorta]|uniref:hypothetical protein n=1 Tax=Faecalicatena contorta TaxID=39482 RepID=UPI001F287D9E|nr:hypothetical protein [Faecalicatena contorta]MCF2554552.1 hypothetical protein [Faecalicatena contorta]